MTPNSTPIESLAAGFPKTDRAAWEALVRAKDSDPARALTTELEDGIEVQWLYAPDDELAPDPGGLTGADPFVRGERLGTPWAIRQQNATSDRRRANRELLEDLEGGATEVLLVTASDGASGIPASDGDQLEEVLDGVHLDLAPVALAAGTDAGSTAQALLEVWRRRGHPAAEVRGSLRLDPVGTLARGGDLAPGRVREETEAAIGMLSEVRAEYPHVRVLGVDTTAYVEAGAGAPFELAAALATAIAYLRAGDDAGVDPGALAAALEFTLCAGPDQFLEIAKLRAVRRLWSGVLAHCGVESAQRRSAVYVRTSRRMVSALDPWVNLLRATSAAFAAAVAGADGITVLPFDEPVLSPGQTAGALGRRMARNTQLVLLEEASLHRVSDPAGGSWYVEALTDQLARTGWAELQAIERAGGIAEALRSGEITRHVAAETARRHDDLAHRRRSMTGVNTFPLLGDDGLERVGIDEDEALDGVPETLPDTGTLPAGRDAAPFEALRARAVRIAAERDREPTILLACLGPLSAHVSIALWAKSFFEAGGVTTLPSGVQPDAEAQVALLSEHGLRAAAVCAGRDASPELQGEVVQALRDGGARVVYLAGASQDAAVGAGADAGVRDGVDMVQVLGELLDRFEEGAL
ncbi:MAG TPA: methylmalonyl-CoA mutase family protein [Solirubrobacteraceae bacterium]|nr:methylmalonyl-CoA mutase family protein [Solirubrobacteraceae bacterium]